MMIRGVRLSGGREERTSYTKGSQVPFYLLIKNNKGILLHVYIKHKGLFLIFAHRAARERTTSEFTI